MNYETAIDLFGQETVDALLAKETADTYVGVHVNVEPRHNRIKIMPGSGTWTPEGWDRLHDTREPDHTELLKALEKILNP